MKTFYSTLVFIICIFSRADWAFADDYEALVIIERIRSNLVETLPRIAAESVSRIIYPGMTDDGFRIEYLYLCPARKPEAQKDVEEISDVVTESGYCLENNSSAAKPSKCQREVMPALVKHQDKMLDLNPNCNNLPEHKIYYFGFNYCRVQQNEGEAQASGVITFFRALITTIKNPKDLLPTGKVEILPLYYVCFHTTNLKTSWMRHRIASGFMFHGPGLPSQRIQPSNEYSTEKYELPDDTFTNISEEYEKAKDSTYKMIPQMMVPHEDLALIIWKKATTHWVNTAALWETLVPLMRAINDGIRKAATIVTVKTYQPDTMQFENFDIYTVTYSPTFKAELEAWTKKANILTNDLFGWNIWCKFVYYEEKKKGVMIYLHNLPTLPPKKIDPEVDLEPAEKMQNIECKVTVPCNFREWSNELNDVGDDVINYAYCCKVDNKKIKNLFNIELTNELDLLDINKIINENSI